MSGENKLRIMQTEYNEIENQGAQIYEKEFVYQVLSRELFNPSSDELHTETLVQSTHVNHNDSESFVALRRYIAGQNNHVFYYIRIATDYQYDLAGRQKLTILTLPLEDDSSPFFTFEHMQYESINQDVFRISISPRIEKDERFQLSYVVNLRDGFVKRLAQKRQSKGYSAIQVYTHISSAQSQQTDVLFSESRQFIRQFPDPLVWDKQIFCPRKSHR